MNKGLNPNQREREKKKKEITIFAAIFFFLSVRLFSLSLSLERVSSRCPFFLPNLVHFKKFKARAAVCADFVILAKKKNRYIGNTLYIFLSGVSPVQCKLVHLILRKTHDHSFLSEQICRSCFLCVDSEDFDIVIAFVSLSPGCCQAFQQVLLHHKILSRAHTKKSVKCGEKCQFLVRQKLRMISLIFPSRARRRLIGFNTPATL